MSTGKQKRAHKAMARRATRRAIRRAKREARELGEHPDPQDLMERARLLMPAELQKLTQKTKQQQSPLR
jgi:hypothetical protein